jgi:hypothetical protein
VTLPVMVFRLFPPTGERRYPEPIPGDIELYYTINAVVTTINAALSIFLLIAYISIYRRTKSEFTLALIIFSFVFFLNALVSSPLVHGVFGFRGFGLGPFAMLPDLLTCFALAVLVYLTFKY